MKLSKSLIVLLAVILALVAALSNAEDQFDIAADPTKIIDYKKVMADYVNKPTPKYSYQLLSEFTVTGATVYVLNMTSVEWLPEEFGYRALWFHYLEVVVPTNLDKSLKEAFVYITNGDTTDGLPTGDPITIAMATVGKTIGVTVKMIPNQPLTYANDPLHQVRVEDGIIGYAWKHIVDFPRDVKWIPRLPMTKASLLALDTTQSFVPTKVSGVTIEKFTVAGASKRGWTTWTVGIANDPRVKALIPLVIQIPNTQKAIKHIYNSLCDFPIAMYDYIAAGFTPHVNSYGFTKLCEVIDPFEWKEDLAKYRKYMVNSMGDEFFWPDMSTLSYNDMPNRKNKHLRYIPNTGHGMTGSDVVLTVASFYYAVLKNIELPEYTFSHTYTAAGVNVKLNILNGKVPTAVKLWSANNPNGRDFRQTTIGRIFTDVTVAPKATGNPFEYEVFFPNPAQGYTALTIELTFDGYFEDKTIPYLKFTTDSYVVPNVLPCDYDTTFGTILTPYKVISKGSILVQNSASLTVPGSVATDRAFAVQKLVAASGYAVNVANGESAEVIENAIAKYDELFAATCTQSNLDQNIPSAGLTFTAGVYCFPQGLNGNSKVTFSGTGKIVLKLSTNLNANNINFVFTNGATQNNVFWVIGNSVAVNGPFYGNVLTKGVVNFNNVNLYGYIYNLGGNTLNVNGGAFH